MTGKRGNPNWIKGHSGNPGGRPKALAELQALARQYAEASVNVLAEALKHKDHRIRIVAAQTLLDRGYGKPAQTVTVQKSPLDDVDPATLAALAEALGTGSDELETGSQSPTVN